MGKPTASDPLGQQPDLGDFGDVMNGLIDTRIEMHLRGRYDDRFNGVPDAQLVHELLARGWAVYFPTGNKR